MDIENNEKVLKGVDEMTGLGASIMYKALHEGLEQGLEQGIRKGMEQGIQQGENLLAKLVGYLKRDGRLNELDQIADEESRKWLYREYNLID